MTSASGASGIGLATLAADGSVLDTWFPAPELSDDGPSGTVRLSVAEVPDELAELVGTDDDRGVEVVAVRTVIESLDDKAVELLRWSAAHYVENGRRFLKGLTAV